MSDEPDIEAGHSRNSFTNAMSPSQGPQQGLLQYPGPELQSIIIEKTESVLLKFVRTNLDTQYASKTPLLAEFRDAISAHGSASASLLVQDFRRCVPLSDYDAYKPFMAAFDKCICKETEVENLFAPGLPYLLAVSSSTSGKAPKIFPKYASYIPSALAGEGPVALMLFYGYRELKYVEREPGQTVKTILVSTASSGVMRTMLGWTNVEEDESRMSMVGGWKIYLLCACGTYHTNSPRFCCTLCSIHDFSP